MSPSVIVVIRQDPRKTHRPVEALRIALGLSTGENPLKVVLLGEAPLLLAEEPGDDIVDVEILEKYLPSLKHLEIPFLVPVGSITRFGMDSDFCLTESSLEAIRSSVVASDRVLVF
ncbi:MAG: DsrE family protein [Nitrospira sp.]|nr:DsrE family protein [Nitrospira sp.]